MGAPKQKWTSEEEAALKAGIAKHGSGKWRTILKDPEFSDILRYRSNVDLKDKWRNMNVTASGFGSREKGRITVKKSRPAPKYDDDSMELCDDTDEEVMDAKPLATATTEPLQIAYPKKAVSRLDSIIMEAIRNLKEPAGSNKSAIATYIEDQYWAPDDFDQVLSDKLKVLTASGKLIKVNRKYRIAPCSAFLEGRSSKALLFEGAPRSERTDVRVLTKSQVDADLARMRTMSAEEAAAAAACAVAEAEAIMAEAEAAAREAEAAEAEAEAAQAFAEAAMLTLKNRNASKLIVRG